MLIENPILRGFNPDPSIIRVGEDYYIATSTFEWFPGVQLHHSKDLVRWELVGQILHKKSQLDLLGVPDSCGVWAPCLSYKDGIFYLVYTNVKSFAGVWKDTPNYLVTTTDIRGEWSEPIYLHSRGFDGSLFHQSNGKKWFLNMLIDHRLGKFFGGIEMQEYDPKLKRLVGQVHYLTEGTALGCTEGPHLLEKDGFFYLILAEGGTEYNHAVSIARSKDIMGPYTYHPDNPILSAKDSPSQYLQKTGHADFVQSPQGDWYMVFLASRPLSERGRCVLGRETAIEKLHWKGGWPYVTRPRQARKTIEIDAAGKPTSNEKINQLYTFEAPELSHDFQSLRIPKEESWCSLSQRKGYLRLIGKESLNSFHHQSLVARRLQHFNVEVITEVEFNPKNLLQMAGLVFYYNTGHYHYANITANYDGSKQYLSIVTADNYSMEFQEELVEVTAVKKIHFMGKLSGAQLQFFYALDQGNHFHQLGKPLDASILSDDYVQQGGIHYRPAFTGCFVGMCCQDLATQNQAADFKSFHYRAIN